MTGGEDAAAEQAEQELVEAIGGFSHDPLGFVKFSFPWGEPGTELEKAEIEEWQLAALEKVGQKLRAGELRGPDDVLEYVGEVIRMAVASGHGIGKSAFVSWVILWALATFEDTKGIVTAETDTQLKTKTWPELGKWYQLFIARHWFVYTATAIYSADPAHERTWRIDAIPWSLARPEAFAGLHNKRKRLLLIFDEASAIPDPIWEVAEGALTDEGTEILWFVFGNYTRNNGRFHDCFTRYRHRWDPNQIDSRKVRITNKAQIEQWRQDYGEDSDFFRVRVRGEAPKMGDRQFIESSVIAAARGRVIAETSYSFAPKILTLDGGWEGKDEKVISLRQGLAFKILKVFQKSGDDGKVAAMLADLEDTHEADAVFIDFGYGTGVYSFGKAMGRKWTLVNFAGESSKPEYLNKRAEMWGLTRDWLRAGGAIPDDAQLAMELAAPELVGRVDGLIQLESKKDLANPRRLGCSPGRADSLVLSFAMPVRKTPPRGEQWSREKYDPLGDRAERLSAARKRFSADNYDPFRERSSGKDEVRRPL